jgi:hypothetical protein
MGDNTVTSKWKSWELLAPKYFAMRKMMVKFITNCWISAGFMSHEKII